jgi:hypothetical protein
MIEFFDSPSTSLTVEEGLARFIVVIRLLFNKVPARKLSMVDRTATAELAKLKNTEAYWELQVRNGKFLPEFSSKYINEKMLGMIEQGKVFTLSQEQVIFRICVKAPSKLVLV